MSRSAESLHRNARRWSIPTRKIALLGCALLLPLAANADVASVGVGDASVTQPASGSTPLNFTVTRSGDSGYPLLVPYATADGTAHAGVDYSATSGSLSIPAGAASATIAVPVLGGASSGDRTFTLKLSNPTGVGPAPGFATQQGFATDHTPQFLASADLNGDGRPDLLTANYFADSVSVLVNDTAPGAAAPAFADRQSFIAGPHPRWAAIADINGDGRPDVIVVDSGVDGPDSAVSILINTTVPGASTVSFADRQVFPAGTTSQAIAVADLNGDGRPDIVTASYAANTVSVQFNTTAPGAAVASFAAAQSFAVGASPRSIAIVDLNGDGRPDLAVANGFAASLSVLLNTTAPGATTPSFAAQQSFATGDQPRAIVAVDVNGDGRPDLVTANSDSNDASVLINTTAPGGTTVSFAAQRRFSSGVHSMPFSVATPDLNGDGRPDLVLVHEGAAAIAVRYNTTAPGAATPSFSTLQRLAVGAIPFSVGAADFNGDGRPDLAVANEGVDSVSVLLNTTPASAATPGFAAQVAFSTSGPASVCGYTGPSAGPWAVTSADLNGDGRPDLLVANYKNCSISVRLNTTKPGQAVPSYSAKQQFYAGGDAAFISTADINGDGLADVLVANPSTNTSSVLLNTTAPGATTASFSGPQSLGINSRSVAAADIDGDGRPDLVAASPDVFGDTVVVLLNTTPPGSATASFAPPQRFPAGSLPFAAIAVDMNGDGRLDLVVANELSDNVWVLLNTTTPGATTLSFAPQQTFATGSGPDSVIATDLNGDGRPDLVLGRTNSTFRSVILHPSTAGAATSISVLLNTTAPGATTMSFAPFQSVPTGLNPIAVASADLNGDGRPDLLSANFSSNSVSLLVNTTTPGASIASFAAQRSYPTGNEPYSVTTADLNGDGSRDLLLTNVLDNSVSVLLNTLYSASLADGSATGTIHGSASTPPDPCTDAVPTLGCTVNGSKNQLCKGGDGDNVIVGTPGDDVIIGGKGRNFIDGGAGNDLICGGPASDVLHGGDGNDRLYGRGGSDIIAGDAGDDVLVGGAAADGLGGDGASDALDGGDGRDDCTGGDTGDRAINCESRHGL